jgi:uncharacterized Zn-finger protein
MAERGVTTMSATSEKPVAVVELGASDLKGGGVTYCPNPKMTLWNQHPRVFIDVAGTGEGRCPYCGTVYRLRAGEAPASHGH